LEEVRRVDESYKRDVEELEQELVEVEARRKAYEDMVAGESQSQGRNVQLEDAQVEIQETRLEIVSLTVAIYDYSLFSLIGERIQ